MVVNIATPRADPESFFRGGQTLTFFCLFIIGSKYYWLTLLPHARTQKVFSEGVQL